MNVYYVISKDAAGHTHDLGKFFSQEDAKAHADKIKSYKNVAIEVRDETSDDQHALHKGLLGASRKTPAPAPPPAPAPAPAPPPASFVHPPAPTPTTSESPPSRLSPRPPASPQPRFATQHGSVFDEPKGPSKPPPAPHPNVTHGSVVDEPPPPADRASQRPPTKK